MANKFNIMSGMTCFDAVNTNGVTICRVTRLAPEITSIVLKIFVNLKINEFSFQIFKFIYEHSHVK